MPARVDYDTVAPSYDRRYVDRAYPGIQQTLLDFAAEPGLAVLEVGCGTGHWLELMLAHGAHVAGLDASEGMLERARAHLPPGTDLQHGAAERLPWPDGSFDRLICINAIHHFGNPPAFVAEAFRVLRPGGKALVIGIEPAAVNRWCVYEYFDGTREGDERRFPAASTIRRWLSEAGFASSTSAPAEHLCERHAARAALDAGMLGHKVTSQLTLLSRADYDAGMRKIERAIADAEQRGETLTLDLDLFLYATIGVR